MNFDETYDVLRLDLLTNICNGIGDAKVPFILGEAGIGKTSCVEKLAKDKTLKKASDCKKIVVHTISGSLLKEGEITGVPYVNLKEKMEYMINPILRKINKASKKGGILSILFIDELNRADHQVMQELMVISLGREIHGKKLPESCLVVAAGNPANPENELVDYQVREMNTALKSRFNFIDMEVDVENWLIWATNAKTMRTEVTEFIADHPELLLKNDSSNAFPDPRGWEKVSFTLIAKDKYNVNNKTFLNSINGTVGNNAVGMFNASLINIFETKFSKESKNAVKKENDYRIIILNSRILKFLTKKDVKNDTKGNIERYVAFLELIPKDILRSIMTEIFNSSSKKIKTLSSKLFKVEAYADNYLEVRNAVINMKMQ